ncbi:hypothetical protein BO71DRAFT_394414 [Aspergillus ellipticus CBS 707.79]|uniref:Uncharacterized protein n=1 Tax=Aspergillus ellipticus CBS 707.79 TaxID=1448320 RepID=A0A319E6T1_9EURO|nr:hypothetical protein BO71DRAFT_394414 [Aspergillus ellipticus CBS 707.79]
MRYKGKAALVIYPGIGVIVTSIRLAISRAQMMPDAKDFIRYLASRSNIYYYNMFPRIIPSYGSPQPQ